MFMNEDNLNKFIFFHCELSILIKFKLYKPPLNEIQNRKEREMPTIFRSILFFEKLNNCHFKTVKLFIKIKIISKIVSKKI